MGSKQKLSLKSKEIARLKVIMEDENGNAVTSKYYELGTDFSNIDKIEDSVLSISGTVLSNITHHLLSVEQERFLKKVNTKLTANMQ